MANPTRLDLAIYSLWDAVKHSMNFALGSDEHLIARLDVIAACRRVVELADREQQEKEGANREKL